MKYNKKDDTLKNYRKDFDVFINNIIKYLDLHKLQNRTTDLISIHFYPMIVIFENI